MIVNSIKKGKNLPNTEIKKALKVQDKQAIAYKRDAAEEVLKALDKAGVNDTTVSQRFKTLLHSEDDNVAQKIIAQYLKIKGAYRETSKPQNTNIFNYISPDNGEYLEFLKSKQIIDIQENENQTN